jgi:hypothetical protein
MSNIPPKFQFSLKDLEGKESKIMEKEELDSVSKYKFK